MTTGFAVPIDLLDTLGSLQGEFLATIPEVDPTTRVPWCGRWRVRDLVVHLARIHHWAAGQARRRQETPLGRGPFDLVELYAACAAELRETLVELGPDARSWTLVGDGTASFWHRRQTHETLVHLWDLRTAGGLPLAAAPVLWADTVDEVVTVMQPRQVALGRMEPLPVPIALHATDAGRRWVLGAESGVAMRVEAGVEAGVEVSGRAEDLALLLWGRRPADDPALAVSGDPEVLEDALARRMTP